MIQENPYDSPSIPSSSVHRGLPPRFRKGVSAFATVIWNIPLVVCLGLMLVGKISYGSVNWYSAAWATTLPFSALSLAYLRPIQSLLLEPDSDVRMMRPGLWAFAIFWTCILAIWYTSLIRFPRDSMERLREQKTMHEQIGPPKSATRCC
jgi:hypothetical protein